MVGVLPAVVFVCFVAFFGCTQLCGGIPVGRVREDPLSDVDKREIEWRCDVCQQYLRSGATMSCASDDDGLSQLIQKKCLQEEADQYNRCVDMHAKAALTVCNYFQTVDVVAQALSIQEKGCMFAYSSALATKNSGFQSDTPSKEDSLLITTMCAPGTCRTDVTCHLMKGSHNVTVPEEETTMEIARAWNTTTHLAPFCTTTQVQGSLSGFVGSRAIEAEDDLVQGNMMNCVLISGEGGGGNTVLDLVRPNVIDLPRAMEAMQRNVLSAPLSQQRQSPPGQPNG